MWLRSRAGGRIRCGFWGLRLLAVWSPYALVGAGSRLVRPRAVARVADRRLLLSRA